MSKAEDERLDNLTDLIDDAVKPLKDHNKVRSETLYNGMAYYNLKGVKSYIVNLNTTESMIDILDLDGRFRTDDGIALDVALKLTPEDADNILSSFVNEALRKIREEKNTILSDDINCRKEDQDS